MAVVEQTVDLIGDEALCDMLLTKVIPNGFPVDLNDEISKKVRRYAFFQMEQLQSVRLVNVTSIDEGAFRSCTSLKSVEIEKCTQIGQYAFTNCGALESVHFPNVVNCSTSVFSLDGSVEDHLKTAIFEKLSYVTGYMFSRRTALEVLYIPRAWTINEYGLQNCSSLAKIDLPSMQVARNRAFTGCSGMQVINIGPKLNSIEPYAFIGLPEGCVVNMELEEGSISGAPWGGTNVIFNYGVPYSGDVPIPE